MIDTIKQEEEAPFSDKTHVAKRHDTNSCVNLGC